MPLFPEKYNGLLLGTLFVAGAALMWSFDGTFLRPHLFSLPPVLVVFLEHALGFLVLVPFIFYHRKLVPRITKKTWIAIGWVALFGGALGTTFFTKALFLTGFTDISVVILLQKFQPIFAMVLAALFLRERFPKGFYLYALLAIVAGYFVTFKDISAFSHLFSVTGAVAGFSLLAAFSWGSATVFGKYSLGSVPHGLLSALRFGVTTLLMCVPVFFFSGGDVSQVDTKAWSIFVLIAFTSGSGAMFLYYVGLKKIPASLATLAELAWPLSAIFFDYALNGNALSFSQLMGAVALVAIVMRITYLMRSRVVSGKVEAGLGKGKELGVCTANLPLACAGDIPKGLYTCDVETADGLHFQGLLYYGWNSLRNADSLEVHLLHFTGDLYGQEITARTKQYLRLPKKFDSTSALMAQIKKDVARGLSDETVA